MIDYAKLKEKAHEQRNLASLRKNLPLGRKHQQYIVKVNKAYQMLGVRNFIYLTPDSFMVLYKALVRSHLEHAVSVWIPHHQLLIEKLEQVQKRSTKLVTAVKHFKCEERLKQLNLPRLKYRRITGDMIEVL